MTSSLAPRALAVLLLLAAPARCLEVSVSFAPEVRAVVPSRSTAGCC
jgi:hypothetical protein